MPKDIKFIAVSGFYGSGSSAVVDLLKEYDNTYECRAEIRTIKDPYGIMQLERALTDDWEMINSAAAIRDFMWLNKICARSGRMPWSPAGLGYSKTISKKYMDITRQYIMSLTDFEYRSDLYYQKFKKNYVRYVTDRVRFGIERVSKRKFKTARRNMKPSCFAKPSHEKFYKATQEYFNSLFEEHANGKETFVILDQAISPNNPQVIHKYFEYAKLIVVDRDPRDIYIEGILWGEMRDSNLHTKEAGKQYVIKHRALRDCNIEDNDILRINFEDLVFNYDNTTKIIEEFLGFTPENHIHPRKFLIPEKSAQNSGIWKKYYNEYKDALDVITNELSEYCCRDARR